ncbi:hypothetical protein GYMLUDRAFT_344284 [Collybiopsis luxurians FD-317 M1]|nr:hypothetical protein GYMLUDRAFT_344284 [Collybiopsis luxurians FD-317 M1]
MHANSKPGTPSLEKAISRLEQLQRRLPLNEREEMAIRKSTSFSSRPIFYSTSLGKFAATTATFCWPSLKPFSQLEEPSMFRDSDKHTPGTSMPRSWPPSQSFISPTTSTSCCTTPTSEAGSLKRSRGKYDEDVDDDRSVSSGMFEYKPPGNMRMARTRKELFDDAYESDPASYSPPVAPKEVEVAATQDIIKSSSAGDLQSNTKSQCLPLDQHRVSSGDYSHPLQADWVKFTVHIEKNDFRCIWKGCKYQAKKQLVKRHIQTTHMKLKPFICRFCDRKFPQKTSLNVHVASKHTRDNPYKCPFDGCTKAFNDPARLHRHKTHFHNYLPKPTIRCKRDSHDSQDENDRHS